jgi:hypothetical protein
MIAEILILAFCIVLIYASVYDYHHKKIELETIILIFLLGMAYLILGYVDITEYIGILIFMAFIFAIPCLFSFGFGDFLLFISFAPFLKTTELMWTYLILLLLVWFVWHLFILYKYKKEGKIQTYRSTLSAKTVFTVEYPLVPVITIAFFSWIIYTFLYNGLLIQV